MSPEHNESRLPPHEWAAVLLILAFLFSLAAFAVLKRPPHFVEGIQDVIVVKVRGDVENPGYCTIHKGALLKDIYPLVKPISETEAVGLQPDSVLQDGQSIKFKSLLVKVAVKGAVRRPANLKLKKGAILAEYLDLLELEPDADVEKVKNRLIRRQNQTITIPRKRV